MLYLTTPGETLLLPGVLHSLLGDVVVGMDDPVGNVLL